MNQSINQRHALIAYAMHCKYRSCMSLRWARRRLTTGIVIKKLRELAILMLILALIGISGRIDSEDAELVANADVSALSRVGDQ
ncbi:hypothetical protein F6R98_10320 [Candidatus Methylospira mobilis]|uniref:Uncharacterized protein n=1 Tax=Candidatus Methylospira mobilis TaxID=1808979 RepID=A0A5Q0BLG4_9GAMM|nr:hypothetical protein [Candidatus Methylospira mobilis]QFY42958.1 hypothetical protein F6R98_10320 [Candidatus Methylospira mobilis]